MRHIIGKRYTSIFKRLNDISIDGFKRERYVIKIGFLEADIMKKESELR